MHGTASSLAEDAAVGTLVVRGADGAKRFACTATLISSTVAISAAHCVRGMSASALNFVLGNEPTLVAASSIPIRRTVVHPDYAIDLTTSNVSNDLALVMLAQAPADVQPALLGLDEGLSVGQQVELVGYGATSFAERADPDARRKNAGEGRIEALTSRELVIGKGDEVQGCIGDSGGPAFVVDSEGTRRLIAVTSRALDPDAPCAGGSVHTRVDAYLDFIASALDEEQAQADGCALHAANPHALGNALVWAGVVAFGRLRKRKRRPRRGVRCCDSRPASWRACAIRSSVRRPATAYPRFVVRTRPDSQAKSPCPTISQPPCSNTPNEPCAVRARRNARCTTSNT